MNLKFMVQNPHNIPVTKQVEVAGEMVTASLDGFEVNLLSQDGMSGTLVLRFFGNAAKEAREKFVADSIIDASFTVYG